jgi:hypothetical protein
MGRSKNYTLIDEISESDSDGPLGGYYGGRKTRKRYGSERDDKHREEHREDKHKETVLENVNNKEPYSEAKMNRFYAGHTAPRSNAQGVRVNEINDRPLTVENFQHPAPRVEYYQDPSSCKHTIMCSKCHKKISLWGLIQDELSTVLLIVSIIIIMYLLYSRRPNNTMIPLKAGGFDAARYLEAMNTNGTNTEAYF